MKVWICTAHTKSIHSLLAASIDPHSIDATGSLSAPVCGIHLYLHPSPIHSYFLRLCIQLVSNIRCCPSNIM